MRWDSLTLENQEIEIESTFDPMQDEKENKQRRINLLLCGKRALHMRFGESAKLRELRLMFTWPRKDGEKFTLLPQDLEDRLSSDSKNLECVAGGLSDSFLVQ